MRARRTCPVFPFRTRLQFGGTDPPVTVNQREPALRFLFVYPPLTRPFSGSHFTVAQYSGKLVFARDWPIHLRNSIPLASGLVGIWFGVVWFPKVPPPARKETDLHNFAF